MEHLDKPECDAEHLIFCLSITKAVVMEKSVSLLLSRKIDACQQPSAQNIQICREPFIPFFCCFYSIICSEKFFSAPLPCPALGGDHHLPAQSLPLTPLSPVQGGHYKDAEGKRYGMDTEEWSQWQNEFRGQIRALRHWLKSMEMRLPPVDPTVSSTG
ncbi:hypothetical protein AMELA_G00077320 [Ameiurus melas]|uniref:Uncharacterized protein n=1 Tax=Ameiurus melas TaxID=219545 RepID=A0A7J6B164_AMEME|nr:hypothetical protein AMELA_G00077320 [Ameiurus melas]